jgi:membrane protease YdiL (CAAX protease family)
MAQMATIGSYTIATYFVLTFAISWGSILVVVGLHGFPGTQAEVELLLPWVVMAMLVGPSVTGVGMTCLVHGWSGCQRLLSGLLPRRQLGARWWVIALLLAPLTIATVLTTLSLTDPMYLPIIFTSDDKASVIVLAFTYALAAGFFEELGWTAFAVHELRSNHSILATGVIVGIVWGAWHLLVGVWGSGIEEPPGAFSATAFLPQILFYVAVLPGYRVLMVWTYERTAKLGAAMVMHASLTASLPLALAPSATGVNLAISYLVLAVVLWVGIAVGAATGTFGSSGKEQRLARRGMLLCGVISTPLYIASIVLSAARWKGYDSTSQTISELIALDAPTRALMGPLFVVYSLLIIGFGVGMRITAGENLALRLVAIGLVGKEVFGAVVTLFFPIHVRGIERTYIDTLHGVLTLSGVLFILLALGAGSTIFGAKFRSYTWMTIALVIVGGCLAGADGPKLEADLPTAWMGVWERVSVLAYLLWVAVLSLLLLTMA